MGLDVVLNEVSFIEAASISQANQLMSDLFKTIAATNLVAGRGNAKIEMYTPRNLLDLPLAPDYSMRRWLSAVDERQRRLFLAIATKEPYIDDVTESYEEEFFYQEKPVKSLGYAYQKDALAVSLLSDSCWNFSHLTLEYHLLASEMIIEEQVTVAHASSEAHVQEHSQWIKALLQAEAQFLISNGSILWEHREELFPRLQFCADVEAQLLGIARGNVVLRQILSKLSLLEQHCKGWDDGPFEPQKLASKATPESQATLNQYGNERTFLCPDGQLLTFSWHVRLTPHAWRIHFFPLEERRQLIIGYIGPHLPTVKHH